jgi:hypothetical protein
VSIKFQVPPGCEVSQVIANLTAHLGLKSEGHGGGSDMILRSKECQCTCLFLIQNSECFLSSIQHGCLATNPDSSIKAKTYSTE